MFTLKAFFIELAVNIGISLVKAGVQRTENKIDDKLVEVANVVGGEKAVHALAVKAVEKLEPTITNKVNKDVVEVVKKSFDKTMKLTTEVKTK